MFRWKYNTYLCRNKNENAMKISAKQITKGMTIRVSNISDKTEFFTNAINGVEGYGIHSEEEKNNMKNLINSNMTLFVKNGSIKKDSPIVNIVDIKMGNSNGTYHNNKLNVKNEICLVTDKGTMLISTIQKVELI